MPQMIWCNFGPIRTSGSIVSTLTLHSLTDTLKGPGSFTMTWCADKADEEFWKTIPHQIYVWCELGNSQWANSKNLLAV